MASSVNPNQTPRSEGVRPGSTLFAQGLESIKSPVCSIYAPIMFFLQRVGGAGRGGRGKRPFGIRYSNHTQPLGSSTENFDIWAGSQRAGY